MIFTHNYDTNEVVEITIEQFNELINTFYNEITLVDIKDKVAYVYANKDDDELNDLSEKLSTVDISRTIVMHFDSEFDLYIVNTD